MLRTNMTSMQQMGLRIRVRRDINYGYENERKQL